MIISLLLLSCDPTKPTEEPPPTYIQMGNPIAGVAESFIDFPIGSPMGGYSSRCNYLGGSGKADNRKSAYTLAFNASAGIQTPTTTKSLWLENGDQHFVMIKADVIYIYDGLVEAVEEQLSAETGLDLDGKVSIAASHTHHGPANFSDQIHFYLGGDRYNEEVFQRFVKSMVDTTLEAYESRQPVALGFSVHKDWDADDQVYRDRREDNDALEMWPDQVDGKHPYLWIMRIDTLEGDPLGLFYHFPIHGTLLNDDNTMISTDAPGQIENRLDDYFPPEVVVAHIQGPAGDISPAGSGDRGHPFAQLEALGEIGAEKVYNAWAGTPVETKELSLESVTRSVPQSLSDVKVTRNGSVDWYYPPYQEGYIPDDQIYDEQGNIISPLDEFNAQYGAAFCGYDDPLISTGTIGSEIPPYNGCMQVGLVSYIINGVFQLSEFWDGGEAPLPLPDSTKASISATRIGPVLILDENGEGSFDDILLGFFPGEATTFFAEQYRRRALAELGFNYAMTVAYAQDHEGYLLIPEDWLLGGYESNINLWGPLQGEYLIEHSLTMAHDHLLTDELEPQDPEGIWQPYDFPDRDLPTLQPDVTPTAGLALTEEPEEFYALFPDLPLELQPNQTVPRAQELVQFFWEGGDPGVDHPLVILEHYVDGAWSEVQSESGAIVSSNRADILVVHTPTPLYPLSALQSSHYQLIWQAVSPNTDRLGLPLGIYRFHIYGHTYTGNNETWPWDVDRYDLTSPEFEVVPADLSIALEDSLLSVSLEGPQYGFRLLSQEGRSDGSNPPQLDQLTINYSDASVELNPEDGLIQNGRWNITLNNITDITSIYARDIYGNEGLWEIAQ